jgi:hypothetical protein
MKYANLQLFSDIEPYEVIRIISEKTIEIRAMQALLDPAWKPIFEIGGFVGHCTNQNTQKWFITPTDDPIIRMRKQKNGTWKSTYGRHKPSNEPIKLYNYNF